MVALRSARGLLLLIVTTYALRFDPSQIEYNINTNKTATEPIHFWGEWQNHSFNPSPSNWRFPFYTTLVDRFVNGDPTNDNANGTQFEHDISQTQLRHGGDITGLQDSLDYLQGMGIKVNGTGFESKDSNLLIDNRHSTSSEVPLSISRGQQTDTALLISLFLTVILERYQSGRQQSQRFMNAGCI